MTVALLAPRLPPACDGVGDHAVLVARSLVSNGEAVVIFSETRVRLPEIDSAFVRSWKLRFVRQVIREIRARRVGLLFVEYTPFIFGPRSFAPHAIAAVLRLSGVPVGVFLHEGLYGKKSLHRPGFIKAALLGLRDTAIVALSSATFTASEERRAALSVAIPMFRSKLHVVPIGANVEPVAERRWHVPADRPLRIVTFGVVAPKRRLEALIRMIGAASEDAIRLELIVVGRIWDEPYAERCLALASTLGIADQLRFTGSLDPVDVSGELFRGHLAVTALLEGAVASSGSFLAMLAHGLPILAVRTPHDEAQFRDLVAFTSEEPSSMVEAALEIVQSPDGGVALGRRARAHYEREFRWSDIARRARSIALRTAESRYVARA